MLKLLGLGILAALFFSSTFILNRAMSLSGGSLGLVRQPSLPVDDRLPQRRPPPRRTSAACCWTPCACCAATGSFWLIAGSTGFGIFYAGISFAASYAPSWVVATTWQFTVLASPFVLLLYGRRVPWRGVAFTLLIFLGIVLVSLGQAQASPLAGRCARRRAGHHRRHCQPARAAARLGSRRRPTPAPGSRIPHIVDPALNNPFTRVLLLSHRFGALLAAASSCHAATTAERQPMDQHGVGRALVGRRSDQPVSGCPPPGAQRLRTGGRGRHPVRRGALFGCRRSADPRRRPYRARLAGPASPLPCWAWCCTCWRNRRRRAQTIAPSDSRALTLATPGARWIDHDHLDGVGLVIPIFHHRDADVRQRKAPRQHLGWVKDAASQQVERLCRPRVPAVPSMRATAGV